MRYFDYEEVAREANIPSDKLDKLKTIIRDDFPHDDMMFELHLLRVCMAIKKGKVSIEEAIQPEAEVKR
ncbi:MAG: hypothetical protein ACHQYP_11745 [Nitrospiria bacterium]